MRGGLPDWPVSKCLNASGSQEQIHCTPGNASRTASEEHLSLVSYHASDGSAECKSERFMRQDQRQEGPCECKLERCIRPDQSQEELQRSTGVTVAYPQEKWHPVAEPPNNNTSSISESAFNQEVSKGSAMKDSAVETATKKPQQSSISDASLPTMCPDTTSSSFQALCCTEEEQEDQEEVECSKLPATGEDELLAEPSCPRMSTFVEVSSPRTSLQDFVLQPPMEPRSPFHGRRSHGRYISDPDEHIDSPASVVWQQGPM